MHTTITLLALLAPLAYAKYGLDGCTSTTLNNIITYYVPSSGEICDLLDCGGGRAPPKTTVPGCAAYSGTASYSPSYLSLSTPISTITPTGSPTAIIDKTTDLLPTLISTSVTKTGYETLPGTTIISSNVPGTTIIDVPGTTIISTGKSGSNFTASNGGPSASGTAPVSPGAAAGMGVPSGSLLGFVGAVFGVIALL